MNNEFSANKQANVSFMFQIKYVIAIVKGNFNQNVPNSI